MPLKPQFRAPAHVSVRPNLAGALRGRGTSTPDRSCVVPLLSGLTEWGNCDGWSRRLKMRCPELKDLPKPPAAKTGWPWTEETARLPDTMPDGKPCIWHRASAFGLTARAQWAYAQAHGIVSRLGFLCRRSDRVRYRRY